MRLNISPFEKDGRAFAGAEFEVRDKAAFHPMFDRPRRFPKPCSNLRL
jgi:hypothetical protein